MSVPVPVLYADRHLPDPLDAAFGDPTDPDNSLGYAAFLDADERGELLPAAERLLDRAGLGAEFVPAELGGRLDDAARLGRLLRPIFRRDGALALGHGASNLVGAVNVWSDGDAGQRRWLADILLGGGRVAAAYTDLDSGNDVTHSAFRATVEPDRLVLSGRKEVVNNLGRAEAVTVLARTGDDPGSRSHSLLLLDRAALPRDRVDLLPRFRTSAVRAMYLGGMAFRDCPVPSSSLVGPPGAALETMLRAFQLTRAVLPSAALGGMDTQLRTVTDFAVHRQLYGRAVVDLPHPRAALGGAFLDLLVGDCLATVVCRALHALPRWTSVYAAVVKYFVPLLLREAVDELAVVLGARSFLRSGRHAIFQKHLRDLPVAALVHAGGTLCLASMIPQLPRLARGWPDSPTATDPPEVTEADGVADRSGASVFCLHAPLPPLDLGALAVVAGAGDPLTAVLRTTREELPAGDPLRMRCEFFVRVLAALRRACADLPSRDRTPLAAPASFVLAETYAVVLAAAACVGVWRHNAGHPGPFLRDPAWLLAALDRLARRIGQAPDRPTQDPAVAEAVVAELLERYRTGHAFDLVGRRLA